MTEKEVIDKIIQLRQIKPSKQWIVFTKNRILEEEKTSQSFIFSLKQIFLELFSWLFFSPARTALVSGSTLVILFFGVVGLAQNSLPGDLLYPLKKLTEKSRAIFVSEEEKPKTTLELADKRIEELTKIVENNQVSKLPSALEEIKTTKKIAKRELAKIIEKKPKSEALKITKEITPKLIEIEEKEKKVYSSLGIEKSDEENSNKENNQLAEKKIVEILIQDLKNSSLTKNQKELLSQAEDYFGKNDYLSALEIILQLSQEK